MPVAERAGSREVAAQFLLDLVELQRQPAQRLQVLEGGFGGRVERVGLKAVEQGGLLGLARTAHDIERAIDGFSGLLHGGDDGTGVKGHGGWKRWTNGRSLRGWRAAAVFQPAQDRAARSLAKIGASFHRPRSSLRATVMNCGWNR
ncbi:hypothetical protein [Xylophilus sp.]|uniref:hypothetical protein n=1 Tax=Xylophilus sp. TaxID=2653893 RepID=UPI002D7F83CD|nr:hypothetical protein [Xylophilus sp.]